MIGSIWYLPGLCEELHVDRYLYKILEKSLLGPWPGDDRLPAAKGCVSIAGGALLIAADWLSKARLPHLVISTVINDITEDVVEFCKQLQAVHSKGKGRWPVFNFALADDRYLSWTGRSKFLDTFTLKDVEELPDPAATHLMGDLTELLKRYTKPGKTITLSLASKGDSY